MDPDDLLLLQEERQPLWWMWEQTTRSETTNQAHVCVTFSWPRPPLFFKNSALAGTSHISTQVTSKTGGFSSWLRSQVPCQVGNPTLLPNHRGQHPNAEAHPSGPPPSRLKKEGLDPRLSRNSSHCSSLRRYEKYNWGLETWKFFWFLKELIFSTS